MRHNWTPRQVSEMDEDFLLELLGRHEAEMLYADMKTSKNGYGEVMSFDEFVKGGGV